MSEEDIGREQARLLHKAMRESNLRLEDLWLHYLSIGGEAGPLEIEAYLHHALHLPQLQRDMLAHALNELLDSLPAPRAPYARDVAQREDRVARHPDRNPEESKTES